MTGVPDFSHETIALVVTPPGGDSISLGKAAATLIDQRYRSLVWAVTETPPIVPPDCTLLVDRHSGTRADFINKAVGECRNASVGVVLDHGACWDALFLRTATARIAETGHSVVVAPYRRHAGGIATAPICFADLAAQPGYRGQILFSAAAYRECGGFDGSLPHLQDWDLTLRLALHGGISGLPDALADMNAFSNAQSLGADAAECLIRDRFLRCDIAAGIAGPGFILASARRDALFGARAAQSADSFLPGFLRGLSGKISELAAAAVS
jgi:hypothetical protein